MSNPKAILDWSPFLGIIVTWIFVVSATTSCSAEAELTGVEVIGRPYGEEIIGPYNQPRWSARGRFSAETDVYVLPPISFYLDADYHGTFPRQGKPDHLLTQEFEIGLPYRFQFAFELYEEAQDGKRQIPFTLIEGRYALADWGKIPLNPTLLLEYSFGTGTKYPVEPGKNREQDAKDHADSFDSENRVGPPPTTGVADSYEARLLLGQELGKSIEFAANIFLDQDLGGDREREIGFSTATSYAIRGEALKLGFETSYRNITQRGSRGKAQNIFELGPSFTFKPSPRTRIDLTLLFGTTSDSPSLDLFIVFAVEFGTGAGKEIKEPSSEGGRH